MAILVAGRVLPYFKKTPFVEDPLETRTKSWFLPYTAALYLLAVVVVWLFWGPPWGDGILGGAVDIHESVAYKGIQAVITGTQQYG